MIMGLGANLDWWDERVVGRLSRRYRLLLFDNRGSGRSEKPPGLYSMPLFADDTVALMDAVGIEKAHVLGMSMGGMIAQELALRHPARVQRLVLACTSCGGVRSIPPEPWAFFRLLDRDALLEFEWERQVELLFPRHFAAQHRHQLEAFWRRASRFPTPPAAFRRQLAAILRFNSYGRLPWIQAPTLVLTGTEDVLIPPKNAEILAARIPDARLEVFPGGGHGFMAQFPERFCEVVEAFLG